MTKEDRIARISSLYEDLIGKIYEVFSIFIDYYGEEKVDLQNIPTKEEFVNLLSSEPIEEYCNVTDSYSYTGARNTSAVKDHIEFWASHDLIHTILTDIENDEVFEIVLREITPALRYKKFQAGFILTHFPYVRITNEYDQFIDIKDFFVKVKVYNNGSGEGFFTVNRASYDMVQYNNGYMHSHVSHINTDDFTEFQGFCTGSGPIVKTMATLSDSFDSDIWALFCLELDKVVHVESITGTPYNRLENVGTTGSIIKSYSMKPFGGLYTGSREIIPTMKAFIEYIIKERSDKLKFNYINGSYSIAMTFIEFTKFISNEFISWYNRENANNRPFVSWNIQELYHYKVIRKCFIVGSTIKLKSDNNNTNDYSRHNGKLVLKFRGRDVLLNIENTISTNYNVVLLLNETLVEHILKSILSIINYEYGREKSQDGVSKEYICIL